MLAQIVDDEAATGDHLQSIVPDALQRTLHQLRGETATAQRARRFGVGDDDGARYEAIIGERYCAFDIQFEAAEGFVVANRVYPELIAANRGRQSAFR